LDYSDEELEHWRQKVEEDDKAYAAADQKLATAMHVYLQEMTRITGDRQWVIEPDYALLAVTRVVLAQVCFQALPRDDGDVATTINDYVVETTAVVSAELEKMGCRRASSRLQ
jgi:hypothetical protein